MKFRDRSWVRHAKGRVFLYAFSPLLRPAFCVLGEPLIVFSDAKQRATGFWLVQLFRNAPCLFSTLAPTRGIIE
jgi:hypothetical protein